MSVLFPSLIPKISDSLWLDVDKTFDNENDLTEQEQAHAQSLQKIADKDSDIVPIGKPVSENFEDEEDEEEEEEEESESEEEEQLEDDLETNAVDDFNGFDVQDSPDDVDMDITNNTTEDGDSPNWMT